MACLDMFNTKHQGLCVPMSPRISFSNGFVDTQQMIKHELNPRDAPASSDFEFSVTNNSMMTADELFFKGRLLPTKQTCTSQMQKTTLRDELLMDEDDDCVSPRPSKGALKWKEFLGLKRSHILSKRADKIEGSVEIEAEAKGSPVDQASLQELLEDGERSSRDVEIGM
ncbi:hypothetical protein NE237_024301 [Protea cynaroides]|uniref:Uncharacterized protein n=1 Tax=Protea cynaroides TaxID=273540 RepID=A0A9Q0HHS5_9MAGN|nr:hypothetical protein NE237_024301 [Protea cynaroides]